MILSSNAMNVIVICTVVFDFLGVGALCRNLLEKEKSGKSKYLLLILLALCICFPLLKVFLARVPNICGYTYESSAAILDGEGLTPHLCLDNPHEYRVSLATPELAGHYVFKGTTVFLVADGKASEEASNREVITSTNSNTLLIDSFEYTTENAEHLMSGEFRFEKTLTEKELNSLNMRLALFDGNNNQIDGGSKSTCALGNMGDFEYRYTGELSHGEYRLELCGYVMGVPYYSSIRFNVE